MGVSLGYLAACLSQRFGEIQLVLPATPVGNDSAPDEDIYRLRMIETATILPAEKDRLKDHCLFITDKPKALSSFVSYQALNEETNQSVFLLCSNKTPETSALPVLWMKGGRPGEILDEAEQRIAEIDTWLIGIYQSILNKEGLDAILQKTAALVSKPMYFADASFRMLASAGEREQEISGVWKYQKIHGYLPFHVLMNLIKSKELAILNESSGVVVIRESNGFSKPYAGKVIHRRQLVLGYFFIVESGSPLTALDLEISERMGEVISAVPADLSPWFQQESFIHENFLIDIMQGGLSSTQEIQNQLQALGWDIASGYRLMVLKPQNTDALISHNLISVFSEKWDAYGFTYKDRLIIIYHKPEVYMDQLRKYLNEQFEIYRVAGAMSEAFSDFTQIKLFYRQASRILTLSRETDPSDDYSILFAEDYYLLYRASFLSEQLPLYSPIRKMLDYDQENGTDYCRTLYVYLLSGNNIVAASKALYLHRNTMNYRMSKIPELFGIDLENISVRERCLDSLSLSFRKESHTKHF